LYFLTFGKKISRKKDGNKENERKKKMRRVKNPVFTAFLE